MPDAHNVWGANNSHGWLDSYLNAMHGDVAISDSRATRRRGDALIVCSDVAHGSECEEWRDHLTQLHMLSSWDMNAEGGDACVVMLLPVVLL